MHNHFPYWSMDSWGDAIPPENAEEIIDRVNEMIYDTEQRVGMGAAARLSNELWELYCTTGRIM